MMQLLGAILLSAASASADAESVDWENKENVLDAICGLRPDGEANKKPALVYMQFELALANEAGKIGSASVTPSNFRIFDGSNRLSGVHFDKLQSEEKNFIFWMKPKVSGNLPMAMILVPSREQKEGQGKYGVVVMSEGSPTIKGTPLYEGNCALSFLRTGANSEWESVKGDEAFR